MKVLVIGGGGREHAIVEALSRSERVSKIFCAPGNAGIAALAQCVPVKDTDVDGLLGFARENADPTEVILARVGRIIEMEILHHLLRSMHNRQHKH